MVKCSELIRALGAKTAVTSGLVSGDRLPDFRCLDASGQPRLLYDLHYGQPMVLFLLGDPELPETREELAALNNGKQPWKGINCVAVVTGTPAQRTQLVNSAPINFTLLTDDGSVIAHLLGAVAAPRRSMTAFALDTNLCIIERLERAKDQAPDEFLNHVAKIYQNIAHRDTQVLHQQAPVLFIPRVLDADFCGQLIAYFEKVGGQQSGVAQIVGNQALWRPDPSVKMRRDVYVNEGILLDRIKEVLVRRVLPEIKRCFNYQVTQHEVFKLVCYDADTGGYFRPHRDNESRDTLHRRFAMTLNLNTGDYIGGHLRFPEFSPDHYAPERGSALIFSSSLLHEVTPVTKGRRYVLLGFFFGEADSIAAIEYKVPGASH